MNIDFPDDRVIGAMQPYVRRMFSADSEEGRAVLRESRRKALRATAHEVAGRLLRKRRPRDSTEVERLYSTSYAHGVDPIEEAFAIDGPARLYRFGPDRLVEMSMPGLMNAYLAALEAATAALRPGSVCEVGFGSGKNLFYLAPRFPDIAFSGFELTASGVATAHELQRLPALPPNLARWIGHSGSTAADCFRRIDFRQGNATALPAPDKSVDAVVTVLALEQMADILPRALSEIRRIARRYALFLEPFREANDAFGYLHLWRRNYFRATQRDIAAAGLRPIAMVSNLPNKLTFGAAMLVAEIA